MLILFWNAIKLLINNSIFMQSQANGLNSDGGAVYIWDTNSIINKSVFTNNHVRGTGGAIHINSLNAHSAVIIY